MISLDSLHKPLLSESDDGATTQWERPFKSMPSTSGSAEHGILISQILRFGSIWQRPPPVNNTEADAMMPRPQGWRKSRFGYSSVYGGQG